MVVALTVVISMLAGTSRILASNPACGVRGQSSVTGAKIASPSFQIVGGEDAEPQEFPWQISLQYMVPPGNNFRHGCGGSIINKQYVLTAAHCVDRVAPNSRLVIVGEYNLNQTDPLERKIAVSSITIHPKYKTGGVMYDYALLKLETPLDFSGADKGLMPICLPTKNQVFANQTCTASGWGFTKPSKRGAFPQILQKVDLHIVSLEECRKAYGYYTVREDCMICASFKEGKKSTCYGDSGGPLQCATTDGLYVLAGATSFSQSCDEPNFPNVFARISTQLEWIESIAGATP